MPFSARWRLVVVALAALAALVPVPPDLIEDLYSTTAYATAQPVVTAVSNRVPFALLDGLLVIVVVAWLALAVVDVVHRGPGGGVRAAARIAARTVVWSAGF